MNSKIKKYFIVFAATLLMSSFIPVYFVAAQGAAGITFLPQSGSYKVGQTFDMSVFINPGSEKIDTVRVNLTFSPDFLEVKNFSSSPVFSYQTGSNGFNNEAGTFSWGAGTPGGVQTASNFGTITFKVKKAGDATVSLSKDSLALSAGEDKFNGQLSSVAYALSAPVSTTKKSNQNVQPLPKKEVSQPADSQPSAVVDNAVDTQIISKSQPQNFAASLLNMLSFVTTLRVLVVAAIGLVAALLVLMLYRLADKPALDSKSKK